MALAEVEAERLTALAGRRSARRAVAFKVRTDVVLAGRVTAAARAAGLSVQAWLEAAARAAVPPLLVEEQEHTTT